jgi:DNA-binding NarL/FixJ family response regulator
LEASIFRVLVVDDYEPWRHFVSSALRTRPDLQVISEVSDGSEAVQKAVELQPDLIVLDIGLPKLNGIEAARQIRKRAPNSKILFVSENRSWDIIEEALRTGAFGYVVKSDAAGQLLPAVEAVLQGKQFVSACFARHGFCDPANQHSTDNPHRQETLTHPARSTESRGRHEVGFYSDEQRFIEDLTQFIGSALKAGNAAVVVATESHRDSLIGRLQTYGVDIRAAIEQGRYIAVDVAQTLSTFIVHGLPDAGRFVKAFGSLILTAAKATKEKDPTRVAVFGEGVNLLWAQGNVEAAIQVEKLSDELAKTYGIDLLCGYSVSSVRAEMETHIFQRICGEHSAVRSSP